MTTTPEMEVSSTVINSISNNSSDSDQSNEMQSIVAAPASKVIPTVIPPTTLVCLPTVVSMPNSQIQQLQQQPEPQIRGFQIAREVILNPGTTLDAATNQITTQQNVITQPQRTIHKTQSIVYTTNASANTIQAQPTQFPAKIQRQLLNPNATHQLLNRAIQQAQKIQLTQATSATQLNDKLSNGDNSISFFNFRPF